MAKTLVENRTGISWYEDKSKLSAKEKIVALKKVTPLNEVDFDNKTYKIKSYCVFPYYFHQERWKGLFF